MKDWNERAKDLQPYYRAFQVTERVLLTGHSHQAWPDCAMDGQREAFDDAAQWVDDKWSRAFAKADRLREFYLQRLGDSHGEIALGPNTQDLLVRWLSALPLHEKTRLVTTDGEFHSMRRLLTRLNETSLEVVTVAAQPIDTLAQRLLDQVNDNTAAVLCSLVMFQSGAVFTQASALAAELRRKSVPLLLDAYHLVNIIPFSMDNEQLHDVFVVGGGYKYCQFGEGNCFLRVPKNGTWRPVVTGWYAEFATLDQTSRSGVQYGSGRWAFEGSTYDPTSHYRAVSVIDFFNQQGLDVERLSEMNRAQLRYLHALLNRYSWPADIQLPQDSDAPRGGFLVIKTPRAAQLVSALREQRIFVDSRADAIRLGPAPYVTEDQLTEAVSTLHRLATRENGSA